MKNMDMKQLAQEISDKKSYLSKLIADPIERIASDCIYWLNNVERLDAHLLQTIEQLSYCRLLYVVDKQYKQISSNVLVEGLDTEYRNQDLSQRPYLQATIPLKGLVLSNVYQDSQTSQSCITLIQAIYEEGESLGCLIADFNLDELPLPNDFTRLITNWRQFKGDPAIRGTLFSQQRSNSQLDDNIDTVHSVVQTLMFQHGVFHFKLHYSSSRITLWLYDKPHHYTLHNIEDLFLSSIFKQYPTRAYPKDTCVDVHKLKVILKQFRALRFADDNVYLRSASINIINGMVGLNFSCDGSHYIPIDEFIDNSMGYWLGSLKTG